jgi:hypothetical protein
MEQRPFQFQKTMTETARLSEMRDDQDVLYWRSRPVEERWAAVEFLRKQLYNYDPATARISGFFEVSKPQ